LPNSLQEKIRAEIQKLDKLFESRSPLLDLCKLKEPDSIEISAAALFLHSFYSGVENIISMIVKNIDRYNDNSGHWHKDLFESAFVDTVNRPKILRSELQEPLGDYLTFRHFLRHSYEYDIEWKRLKPLIDQVAQVWQVVKIDLENFIKFR
jgi:hypothetical protein